MSLNDPHWSNRGNGGKRGNGQEPPDLEEVWRDFNQRLSSIFGRRREGGPPSGPGGGGSGGRPALPSFKQFGGGLGLLVLLILVVWLGSGFYVVDANERAVVLRLGKYHTVTQPGLNWRLPWPIEAHETVNLYGLRTVSVGSEGNNTRGLMLTDDMNIVVVQFAVQYVLKAELDKPGGHERGPKDFLFENLISSDDEFVRQIAEAAMREIVGKNKMDDVLYGKREQIAIDAKGLIQNLLDDYKSGIAVSRVTIEGVQPPEQVQAAFSDAIRARQDEERKKNEGEAHEKSVIPAAKGKASRIVAEAEAYRASVIARAEGEAARFTQVLSEFKRAPQVTRERMYLDAVQDVLSNTSKVMIDNKGGGSLIYLPLDKLVQQSGAVPAATPAPAPSESAQAASPPPPSPLPPQGRDRNFLRDRSGREGVR